MKAMKHLSSEQISKVVAGVCGPEEAQHGRDCGECAAEVTRLTELLSMFRGSMHDWSEKQDHLDTDVARPVRRLHWQPRAWVLAGAVLAIVIAAPVYKDVKDREVKAQAAQEAAAQEVKDAMLMDNVNAQLSRTAPAAMEPLMQLMSPESSANSKEQLKSKNGGLK